MRASQLTGRVPDCWTYDTASHGTRRAEFEMTESFTTAIDEDDEEPLVAEVRPSAIHPLPHDPRSAVTVLAIAGRVARDDAAAQLAEVAADHMLCVPLPRSP